MKIFRRIFEPAGRPNTVVAFLAMSIIACTSDRDATADEIDRRINVEQTRQISKHVYLIPDLNTHLVPNVGIIIGAESVLLVDTGLGPPNGLAAVAKVKELTDKPIRYFVSTHFHPEHNLGASALPEETITIIPIRQEQQVLTKGNEYRDMFISITGEQGKELLGSANAEPADITFDRQGTVDLGDLNVELIHFGRGAHTQGDTVVFVPDDKVLFGGGLTPNGTFPILSDSIMFAPEEAVRLEGWKKIGSVRGWIETLEEMEQIPFEILVPGHGDVSDRTPIGKVRDYLIYLESRTLQMKSDGVPLATIKKDLQPELEKRYSQWRVPRWIGNTIEISYVDHLTD